MMSLWRIVDIGTPSTSGHVTISGLPAVVFVSAETWDEARRLSDSNGFCFPPFAVPDDFEALGREVYA
jgi:hypothetical protein